LGRLYWIASTVSITDVQGEINWLAAAGHVHVVLELLRALAIEQEHQQRVAVFMFDVWLIRSRINDRSALIEFHPEQAIMRTSASFTLQFIVGFVVRLCKCDRVFPIFLKPANVIAATAF
jgi:hypothetical protein